MTKTELLADGEKLIQEFCRANNIEVPPVTVHAKTEWRYGRTCAYYRPVEINICLAACANVGTAGMLWSYPGYTVDRTPFGVLAHEVGHHADWTKSERKGAYFGDYSIRVRKESGEERLTSYCPNDAEWFAEMFRLFVTNPDLLRILRPRTFAILRRSFDPVQRSDWDEVLRDATGTDFVSLREEGEGGRRKA